MVQLWAGGKEGDQDHCKYCNFKVMSRAELEIHLEATHHTTGLMRPLSAITILQESIISIFKTPDVIFAT